MTCLRVPHLESRTPRRHETILDLASKMHRCPSTFPCRFSLAGDLRPNPIWLCSGPTSSRLASFLSFSFGRPFNDDDDGDDNTFEHSRMHSLDAEASATGTCCAVVSAP